MQAVDVALTQLGVREATGNNDGVPATRYNRGDCLPWCAAFVLWCAEQAGTPIPARPAQWWLLRAVSALEAEFRARGWWVAPERAPARNDLVFFGDRGASDPGRGRHVGLVAEVAGKYLHTVEGNLGDRVQAVVHDLSDPKVRDRITGWGRIPASGR